MKLEKVFSLHPYTGWTVSGRMLIDCNDAAHARQYGAKFIRNNKTGEVRRISSAYSSKVSGVVVKATYVDPCIACGSLNHKTYSRVCPRKRQPWEPPQRLAQEQDFRNDTEE